MRQDVTVVGGSVVGFFSAYLLSRRGLQVCVLEGADCLSPAPRTLIVTGQLRDLLGSLGESAVVNKIHRFELFADGRVATITLQQPDLVVERSRLVRELAGQAEAAGAQVLLGRRFLSLTPSDRGLTLVTERSSRKEREEVWTRTVIGADGAFSKVAQAAGWPRQPTIPLIQAIVRWPTELPPDTTRVWFIPADTPYFYWLVPESPTRGVLGLIGEDGQETRRCLERFLTKQGIEPLEFQGARIPLYTRWVPVHRQVGEGDVYLVGDAAGQVKVTTVGGIVSGLRGALGVAEAVLNGKSSSELHALRRELDLHLLIRRVLHRFQQADYAKLLGLLNPSTRHALSVHTRDESGKVLRSILLSQPRLLLLGLRALLLGGLFPRQPV